MVVSFAEDALTVMKPGREYTPSDISTRMKASGRKMSVYEARSALKSLCSRGMIRSTRFKNETFYRL